MGKNQITSKNADKLAKINSIGLYVPQISWEFPIDLDILESLTTDFSRNSRVAPLLNCEIEGPVGGITTYHFYELGTIQIRKKRGGWSEIYIKRFKGLFWDKDLLTRKKELQDAIFNDYIDLVRLEVEESNKTVRNVPAIGRDAEPAQELPQFTDSEKVSDEEEAKIALRGEAKRLSMTLKRLERWNDLIKFKDKLHLTHLEMAERTDKGLRTIDQDFHDMKEKGYYPKTCI